MNLVVHINYHHLSILVDVAHTGSITSIDRHGINRLYRSIS